MRFLKFIKKWSKIRKMGIYKYTLIFGGAFGLIVSIFDLNSLDIFSNVHLMARFFGEIVLYAIGFGIFSWVIYESLYTNYLKDKNHEEEVR